MHRRGAPHVCYWHLDGKGLFYVKPDVDEMVRGWQLWLQQQRQQLGLTAQPDSGRPNGQAACYCCGPVLAVPEC